jgi:hypothetical protein
MLRIPNGNSRAQVLDYYHCSEYLHKVASENRVSVYSGATYFREISRKIKLCGRSGLCARLEAKHRLSTAVWNSRQNMQNCFTLLLTRRQLYNDLALWVGVGGMC